MIDWKEIQLELENFQSLKRISEEALDTLHGSMWGLNHRYKTLMEAMKEDGRRILEYSIHRLKNLSNQKDIGFRRRPIPVCKIGFGTYGWKYCPDVLRVAQNHGSLIDCAEGYGYGRVEEALGKWLQSHDVVASKVRRDHMSTEAIKKAVLRSRKKLNVVPHMQLHYPNYKHPNAVKELAKLRQRGYIQSIGLGNCSADMIETAQRFLSDYSGDSIRSVQVRYNLADRRIEKVLLPYCQQRGILVLAYSPLGQKFKAFVRPVLKKIAKKHKCSPARVALAWLLTHRGVMPIPRTNNPAHMKDNILAEELTLSKQDIKDLEKGYQN